MPALLSYAPPTITLTANGAQSAILAPSGKVALAIGTAPQGPDYPTLVSGSQLISTFGDPASYGSVGYTLPYGLSFMSGQRQPSGNSGLTYLVCRAGVTRASYAVKDASSATCFTLQGIGAYAGSKGNDLEVTVTLDTGVVSEIDIIDSSTSTTLISFLATQYDLSTNAKIVAAINGANPLDNGASVVNATIGASTNVPAAVTTQAFSGGADGKGTAANDASIATLLGQSLAYPADYIWPGWDLSSVATALSSHVSTAQGLNSFRKVVGGPAYGTAYSSLSSSYATAFASQRFANLGHDGLMGLHPATGISTIWDGYYGAAALLGLKAVGPAEETCDGFPLSGFSALPLATGQSSPLTDTQLTALGAAANVTLYHRPGESALRVRDFITTAPYTINNSINPYYQFNVQDIDDAVASALVAAIEPYKGRPRLSLEAATSALQAAATTAMAGLGTTINGVNSVTVTVDPATLIPTLSVSYVTRYPLTAIQIDTSFTFL